MSKKNLTQGSLISGVMSGDVWWPFLENVHKMLNDIWWTSLETSMYNVKRYLVDFP